MRNGRTGSAESNIESREEFERHASEARPGLLAELWEFIATNKKWWLTPIVLVVLLVGALIVFSGTGAAPFIYALF